MCAGMRALPAREECLYRVPFCTPCYCFCVCYRITNMDCLDNVFMSTLWRMQRVSCIVRMQPKVAGKNLIEHRAGGRVDVTFTRLASTAEIHSTVWSLYGEDCNKRTASLKLGPSEP